MELNTTKCTDLSRVNAVNKTLTVELVRLNTEEIKKICELNKRGTKKNYCIYCNTLQTKLPRHLERWHKEERQVQSFLDLPKGSLDRLKIIDIIRRDGNYIYNTTESGIIAVRNGKNNNRFKYATWLHLAECTCISILIFNRRRVGETERILIKDFENYQGTTFNTGKTNNYVQFEIRGKLGRRVPVIFDKNADAVKVILQHREEAGVDKENPFVFGVPGGSQNVYKHLNACDLMRNFSFKCGANNPQLLRGTYLRKHIATNSVRLNLDPEKLETLQSHMGHADKIHREIYRLPLIDREIGHMSELLESAIGSTSGNNEEREKEEKKDHNLRSIRKRPIYKDNDNEEEELIEEEDEEFCVDNENASVSSEDEIHSNERVGNIKRTTWSIPERKAARTIFRQNLKHGNLPPLNLCVDMVNKSSTLNNRSGPQLRSWLHNQIKRTKVPEKAIIKRSWTTPEKSIVRREFAHHLKNNTYPSFLECSEVIRKHPELKNRSPRKLKSFLQHEKSKKKLNFGIYFINSLNALCIHYM